ncbi:hypothetical protein [Okibacterium endophyticum]
MRERQHAELSELELRAGSALVQTDERIRVAEDELDFVVAEFGQAAAAELTAAVHHARERLREAFHLNQLLSDEKPDTVDERREWNTRIIAASESAAQILGEQTAVFNAKRSAARKAPEEIARIRAEAVEAQAAIAPARATLERLRERYTDDALVAIAMNPDQAEHLLTFAERSLTVAEQRRQSSRSADADKAIQAAAEAVRRAGHLASVVESFEVDALRAESTLSAVVADSVSDIAEARSLSQAGNERIAGAVARLQDALAALPSTEAKSDPLGSLNVLREANTALENAVREHRDGEARREHTKRQLVTALDDAERQIEMTRRLIADYRAPVGPEARTRLAEAERELADITTERDPDTALQRARRAAALAAEADAFARADLEQPGYSRYGGGMLGQGSGRGGAGMLGGVLGGLVIGGMLDDFGDMGDLFD